MIDRRMLQTVLARLASWPAVALLGPRQVGKTTLARSISRTYFDLEQEADRVRLDIGWDELILQRGTLILDEAQQYPEIFPRIRGAIDADRGRKGRFLILGSVSPALMRQVSESLAGRIAICELTSLSALEVPRRRELDLWLMGGYPDGGILGGGGFPLWQRNYLDLLAMRDLPLWGLPAKAETTKRLFRMLAALHGGQWNASQIGRSLGLSYHTVNAYLEYLEGAFLVRRLAPYHANIKKRLVKSPKVYWRDSGLLHSLLNVSDRDGLLAQPWVGASWEGWIIEQLLIGLSQADRLLDGPYYFRTGDGREIDLVFALGGRLHALEVKLTSSPGQDDLARLRTTADLIGADVRMLVTRTTKTVASEKEVSGDLRGCLEYLLGPRAGTSRP